MTIFNRIFERHLRLIDRSNYRNDYPCARIRCFSSAKWNSVNSKRDRNYSRQNFRTQSFQRAWEKFPSFFASWQNTSTIKFPNRLSRNVKWKYTIKIKSKCSFIQALIFLEMKKKREESISKFFTCLNYCAYSAKSRNKFICDIYVWLNIII